MMPHKFVPGDVLLTYGSWGWWPPRRWVLGVVYKAIEEYERAKWQKQCPNRKKWPTHVRVWLGGMFFEATWPVAKWTRLDEVRLGKKRYDVVRWTGDDLDVKKMIEEAATMIGTPYDWGDLLDMGIAAIAHIPQFRIFGDRMKKYRVCSTAAAQVLRAGGATFTLPDNQIDPACFLANTRDWRVVSKKRK